MSFTKWAQCYLYISYRPKNAQTKEKKPLKFTTHCALGISTMKYFVLLLYFKYSIFSHNIYQYNSWFYRWFYNIVLSCKYWSTGFQLFRIQGNIFVIWWRTHNICECLNMNVYLITKCWLYARISKVSTLQLTKIYHASSDEGENSCCPASNHITWVISLDSRSTFVIVLVVSKKKTFFMKSNIKISSR